MPLEEPAWWYAPAVRPAARLLGPIAAIYGWAAERRYRRGRPYRAGLPVICVGNFTAGGTGKTPLALLIARELAGLGETPAFLTRGYGGRLTGPKVVDPLRDTAAEVGDEALLLAGVATTIVARDRAKGAQAAERTEPAPTVLVMDDGLQNPALVKDLAIAVVDARRGLGNGRVLPAGPLRAPLAFQLTLADAIVINRSAQGEACTALSAWLRDRFGGPLLTARPERDSDVGWLADTPVIAFAGIAHPARFFDMLEGLGARVLERIAFPDHHPFTEEDAGRLLAVAQKHRGLLVTTQKDWVRLKGQDGSRAGLREQARPFGIRLCFEQGDAARLKALLQSVLDCRVR